jgi:hypothetical protein
MTQSESIGRHEVNMSTLNDARSADMVGTASFLYVS